MRSYYFAAFIMLVLLCSCQKETSVQSITGTLPDSSGTLPTDSTSILLTKMVYKENGGGYTDEFTYDAMNRLVQRRLTDNTVNSTGTTFYYYDSQNRLYKIQAADSATKSLITYQSATSNKISFIISKTPGNGAFNIDSAVYTYADVKVQKIARFDYTAGRQAPAQTGFYEMWTYDAKGNPAQLKWYSLDSASGTYSLNFSYQFQYDDKINPLPQNDAFLDEYWSAAAPDNMVQQQNFYPDGTVEVLTTTYEYGTSGRPSVANFSGGGRTAQTFYYYNR